MLQFLFAILLFSTAHAEISDKLFKQISKHTFRVKTALSPNADKASYGTGFVVNGKLGRLITNYHVVSSVIQKKNGGYKNYVIVDEVPFEAKILAVDLIHDLALVEINHQFDSDIIIRETELKQGEKIYSFGIPKDLNLTIVDGLYNGNIKIGPFSTIQMSTPINAGMSGGPTTDVEGKLVGINVATLSDADNITFAVPADFVRDLLEKANKKPLEINNFKELHGSLEKQLVSAQEEITVSFKSSRENSEVGKWKIPSSSKMFKCWMNKGNENIKISARKINTIGKKCQMEHSVYLDNKSSVLIFSMSANSIENVSLNRFQFSSIVNKVFNQDEMVRVERTRSEELESLITGSKCENMKVTNQHQINFLVSFCLRGYVRYPSLIESFVKFAVIDPKAQNTLIMQMTIDGFSLKNIKLLVKEVIDNVHQ